MTSVWVATLMAVLCVAHDARAERAVISPSSVTVIDGDTIKIDGTSYRLKGFDAPETFHAKCAAERELGVAASQRLRSMLNEATNVEIEAFGHDKYRRVLASLYINGADVAIAMISEGRAVPYNGRTKRKDWCH